MALFGKKKYDPSQDLQSGEDSGFNHLNYVVQPGAAMVREPKQKGHGGSVVILPHPRFENPDYQATNDVWPDCPPDSSAEFGVETWMFVADGIRKFGKNPVTMLYDNPDDSGFSMKEHHPVELIRDAVWRAKKGTVVQTPLGSSDSDGWVDLLDGNEKNKVYASIPKSDRLLMMNVLVYALAKNTYDVAQPLGSTKNDQQVVWVVSRDTGKEFLSAIDTMRDKDTGKLTGPITGGKVFHFYDRKNPATCIPLQNAMAASMNASDFELGGDRRRAAPTGGLGMTDPSKEFAGYKVVATNTIDGRPDSPLVPAKFRDQFIKLACKKVKPWNQVLRGHNPDQCAQVIASVCGLPLSLLYHAWKPFPGWYPEELTYALKNPKTVEMRTQTAAAPAPTSAPAAVSPEAAFNFGDATAPATQTHPTPAAAGAVGSYDTHPEGSTPWDGPSKADQNEEFGFDQEKVKEANRLFRERASGVTTPKA